MHIPDKIRQYMFCKMKYTLGNNRVVKTYPLKNTLREFGINITENSTKMSDAYTILRTSQPNWNFFKRAKQFMRFITCYKGNGYDKSFKESNFSAVSDRGKFCSIKIVECGDFFSFKSEFRGKSGDILEGHSFNCCKDKRVLSPDRETPVRYKHSFHEYESIEERTKRLERQLDEFRTKQNPIYFEKDD